MKMELKDLENNASGSYDLVSKKIREMRNKSLINAVFVCQTLNGQKKILDECVINKNLKALLELIKTSHSKEKGNIYFNKVPKGAEISRIYLLTFLKLEKTDADSVDWFQVPSLIDLKTKDAAVIMTEQAILYIIDC
jgi:hypothetical protein